MGRALSQESTRHSASDGLDNLTFLIFHHSMTSEEAYFVAEMARGVDSPIAGKVYVAHLSHVIYANYIPVYQQWSEMYC